MALKGLVAGLALCAALAGTGCAGNGVATPGGEAGGLMVQVENENWSDMVVYARRNTMRARLGLVTSQGKASFRVPSAVVTGAGTLQLEADPVGSREFYRSDSVIVEPGTTISWTIAATPSLSRLSVR